MLNYYNKIKILETYDNEMLESFVFFITGSFKVPYGKYIIINNLFIIIIIF